MRALLIAALGLMVVAPHAVAETLFVNNQSGNDRYDGRSEVLTGERLGPVRTIQQALRLATLSDKIVLANSGEPYRESITFAGHRNSGLDGYPFILEGNGATLEGAEPVPHAAWQANSDYVFRFRPAGLGYQQLFRDARPLVRRRIDNAALGLPKLEPLQWAMHESEVYLRVEKGKIPRDYLLTYAARRTGITLVNVEHVLIKDLTVQGFHIDGLNFHTAARDCTLLGVTARGNGRSGISVGPASSVTVDECTVGSNGAAQIRTEQGATVHVFDSAIFDATAPLWLDLGGRLIIDSKDARDAKEAAE